MAAIIGLLVILVISLTAVRIGAVALELTGLSPDVAAFQAQSAFSGAGFTTSESESIVNHAVRRNIIRGLILVGNVGIVSTGATLIVALSGFTNQNATVRIPALFAVLLAICLIARSKLLYNIMKRTTHRMLSRHANLQLQDYQEVLGINNGYSVARMRVMPENWQIGKTIEELALHKEGTTILSITRKVSGQDTIIIPHGGTKIQFNDLLTLYGREAAMNCLFMRPAGEKGDKIHQLRTDQLDAIRDYDRTTETVPA